MDGEHACCETRKAAEPELLEAAKRFYRRGNFDAGFLIEVGAAIMAVDGWKHIAPAWLEDCREHVARKAAAAAAQQQGRGDVS